MNLPKFDHSRGNTVVGILIFIALMGAAAWIVYNNPDFQKTYRKEISRTRYWIRERSREINNFLDKKKTKTGELKKSSPGQPVAFTNPFAKKEKPKTLTFEDLAYDPKVLELEVPAEMVRHQPDEVVVCAFDANYLLASPLTDKEVQHLANIFRFCDLASVAGLRNEAFLNRLSGMLKILRYNPVVVVSPGVGPDRTVSAFLYRSDRITAVKPAATFAEAEGLPHAPFYGLFRAMDFDFTVVVFQTPVTGHPLPSLRPLEKTYELIKAENPEIKDVMVFGDFAFRSAGLNWDNSSLLPVMARLKKGVSGRDKSLTDLLGNFWFRKKELVEFNGNSGEINITEDEFPSAVKPSAAYRPIWAQFKAMPDDD